MIITYLSDTYKYYIYMHYEHCQYDEKQNKYVLIILHKNKVQVIFICVNQKLILLYYTLFYRIIIYVEILWFKIYYNIWSSFIKLLLAPKACAYALTWPCWCMYVTTLYSSPC